MVGACKAGFLKSDFERLQSVSKAPKQAKQGLEKVTRKLQVGGSLTLLYVKL